MGMLSLWTDQEIFEKMFNHNKHKLLELVNVVGGAEFQNLPDTNAECAQMAVAYAQNIDKAQQILAELQTTANMIKNYYVDKSNDGKPTPRQMGDIAP